MMTPSNTDYLIYVVRNAQSLFKLTQSVSQYLDSIIMVFHGTRTRSIL